LNGFGHVCFATRDVKPLKTFSRLLNRRPGKRKYVNAWKAELQSVPEWVLENIVNNPGEFVVEMRQAATDILSQRRGGGEQDISGA
jgi:hypothetical protein